MIEITEYIKLSKEERQAHIDLSDPCLERGGISTQHRGILVHYLNTNFPQGRIIMCHACGNGKCSNPKHLYWGTDKENIVEDGAKFGTHKSPWARIVDKYGYDEACRRNARPGNLHGKGNKDKPKSEEHKKHISEALLKK